jgi:hypothetical protein
MQRLERDVAAGELHPRRQRSRRSIDRWADWTLDSRNRFGRSLFRCVRPAHQKGVAGKRGWPMYRRSALAALLLPLVPALVAALPVTTAFADTITFHTVMNAASEVPPKTSPGKGMATATLNTATKQLTYTVQFSDLTGPATMAHFHGPAEPGANAGIVVPLGNNPTSPIEGSVTLTDQQIGDLMAGRWYVNVHTAANPAGEIRGQMIR